MIDQSIYNTLRDEFYIPIATLDKIITENLSVVQGNFNILTYRDLGIAPEEIIQLIQYVYGMNLYSANEMYQVVAQGRKAIHIIDEVKKNKMKEEVRRKRSEGMKIFKILNLLPPSSFQLTPTL